MNIATAVPQALAPLIGAGLVAMLGGFVGLFVMSGVLRVRGCSRGRPSESGALVPVDLTTKPTPAERTWTAPDTFWPSLSAATARLDPPLAVLHLPALRHNTHDMLRRAAGKPIRVASKSVRVQGGAGCGARRPGLPRRARVHAARGAVARGGRRRASRDRGCRGRLPDAPTGRRSTGSPRRPRLASRVTLMVDSLAQLDLIDAVIAPRRPRDDPALPRTRLVVAERRARAHRRVAVADLHARRPRGRSPRPSSDGPGFALVGMMGYEAQIAGAGRQADRASRVGRDAALGAEELEGRARRASRAGRRERARGRRAGVRQRRRNGIARVHGVRRLGDRDRRGQRAVRRPPLRHLPVTSGRLRPHPSRSPSCGAPDPRPRRCWVAAGSHPDPRVKTGCRRSPGRPGSRWSTARWPARCRPRSPVSPPACSASATASGCGTPSPAS